MYRFPLRLTNVVLKQLEFLLSDKRKMTNFEDESSALKYYQYQKWDRLHLVTGY